MFDSILGPEFGAWLAAEIPSPLLQVAAVLGGMALIGRLLIALLRLVPPLARAGREAWTAFRGR